MGVGMKRRGFLKLALGAAIAAVVPLKPKATAPPTALPWRYIAATDYGFDYHVNNRGYYQGLHRDVMMVMDFKPGVRGGHVGTIIVDRVATNLSTGDVLVGW